jgi:hypothetical protein
MHSADNSMPPLQLKVWLPRHSRTFSGTDEASSVDVVVHTDGIYTIDLAR